MFEAVDESMVCFVQIQQRSRLASPHIDIFLVFGETKMNSQFVKICRNIFGNPNDLVNSATMWHGSVA